MPKFKRVNGVGDAFIYGAQDYSMRIWLKPDVMAAHGLMPDDVLGKLAEQSIEAAPGKFGENAGQAFQYVIKYKGRLKTAAEFDNIVIRTSGNGQYGNLNMPIRKLLVLLSIHPNTKSA